MTQILSCISCITVSKNHFSAASAVNSKTVLHVLQDPQGKNRFRIPVFISGTTTDIIFLRCQQYTDAVKEPSCQMPGSWICVLPRDRVLPLYIDQKYIRIGCFADIQNQGIRLAVAFSVSASWSFRHSLTPPVSAAIDFLKRHAISFRLPENRSGTVFFRFSTHRYGKDRISFALCHILPLLPPGR